ncbi:hypothetical protein [Mycobacteroides salmoniphilum]|uniref:hypothetical protein n=1 Tax=Mycobacteroides salmoniphilum TaxID=404941 RepID=UPI001F2CA9C4|nr:hypothetical protein [Mycobacteroides salmoniphilum]
MRTVGQSEARTRAFARVLGPFFVIVPLAVAIRAPHMRSLLDEFTAGQLWSWIMGAFGLMGGLAIIAFHQYWRSAAAVIISLLGWLLVIRGIFLLAFPETFANVANHIVGSITVWRSAYVIVAVLGLYLTYAGWRQEKQSTSVQSGRDTDGDLRRAA